MAPSEDTELFGLAIGAVAMYCLPQLFGGISIACSQHARKSDADMCLMLPWHLIVAWVIGIAGDRFAFVKR